MEVAHKRTADKPARSGNEDQVILFQIALDRF
jgi:hypothetical protein